MHKFKTYRKNYDRFPTDYFLVSCPFSIETNTILWVTYKIPKCILQFKVAIEQCRFSRSNLKTNWEIAKVVSNFQGTLHLPTLEPATKNGWGNKYYIAFRYTTTEECRFFVFFFVQKPTLFRKYELISVSTSLQCSSLNLNRKSVIHPHNYGQLRWP